MNNCGLCGLPIHEAELGRRYFGTFTAHSEHRCIELLKLEIQRIRMLIPAPRLCEIADTLAIQWTDDEEKQRFSAMCNELRQAAEAIGTQP